MSAAGRDEAQGRALAGESAHELARRQQTVGTILDDLRPDGWQVFHDVVWPGGQRAALAHVVVGPPGVFVVDDLDWPGHVDLWDQSVRHDGRRHDSTVAEAADAALAVAALLNPQAGASTRAVLCFVRDDALSGWCYDVMVCSTANLRATLLGRPAVLSPDEVQGAATEIRIALRPAVAPSTPTATLTTPFVRRVALPEASPAMSAGSGRESGRPRVGCAVRLLQLGVWAVACVAALSVFPQLGVRDRIAGIFEADTKAYGTCAELRADYPRGVGTRAAVRRTDAGERRPAVEPQVYEANAGLDVDRDGLACER